MTRRSKLMVVTGALILEFIVLACFCNPWPHGEIADSRYRQRERLGAYFRYHEHPSKAAAAVLNRELLLMHKHDDWRLYAWSSLIIAGNMVVIWQFLAGRNRQSPSA